MWAAVLLVVLAGAAIGATGIGGILVVPALTVFGGRGVLEALAASSFAFAFTGAATLLQLRRASNHGLAMRPLHVSALIGALAGAALSVWLAPALLRGLVALIALASGMHALIGSADRVDGSARARPLTVVALVSLGLSVGAGSALTGTGGPVLLLPILLLLQVPLRDAIFAAQAIQLPVAFAASAVHAANGRLDIGLGSAIGLALLVGWWFGNRLALRAGSQGLRRLVAGGLVLTGFWYGWAALG